MRPLTAAVDELLFPPTCAGCGTRGVWLCEDCARGLRAVPLPTCRCGRPAFYGSSVCAICADWPDAVGAVRAAFVFEGPVRDSIHRFKYRRERARGQFLGTLLAEFALTVAAKNAVPADIVVPMPLYAARERERGFNQAEVLARPVAERLEIPVRRALQRTIETRSQVGLGFEERQRNVQHAFKCLAGAVEGAGVLVIDDVVTTGATFEAAARALLTAGAVRVDGLALAREL
ncbi:MAG TPA: ComF family protein [Thermomicrobiaceae bacterium]|nr:ComF family protein [Thermomicrobiaceae bacterium]